MLLADDAEGFAESIIKVINDKPFARLLADNCHDLVCRNYSVQALKSEALSILKYLNDR